MHSLSASSSRLSPTQLGQPSFHPPSISAACHFLSLFFFSPPRFLRSTCIMALSTQVFLLNKALGAVQRVGAEGDGLRTVVAGYAGKTPDGVQVYNNQIYYTVMGNPKVRLSRAQAIGKAKKELIPLL